MKRFNFKYAFLAVVAVLAVSLSAHAAQRLGTPDFDNIRKQTLDPQSRYYYPELLKSFWSNDTTMTADDYHYLYYGAIFQEDYNPYRANPFEKELKATQPLYFRHGQLSRSEKYQIQDLAKKSLFNNPLDLTQLTYMVYAYENSGKDNLAKIWKHKLNHLLLTISRSGTGADSSHPLFIVYPSHEFDFFNLSGITVLDQKFEEPYYEVVTVKLPGAKGETRQYWFDLQKILEQYYAKHPDELNK